MNGFDKIELDAEKDQAQTMKHKQHVAELDKRGSDMKVKKRNKNFRIPKKVYIILGVIVVLLGLLTIPLFATYKSALKTYRQAKLVVAAAKTQNLEVASTEIDKTKADLKDTQQSLHALIPLKFIPVLSWYYNDADHLMNAGQSGLDTGTIVVESLKPYEDVLGLKGQGSFTGGSAQERIKTAVMATGKITPKIDDIAQTLEKVQKEMDQVQPWHYPEFIFGKKVKAQLVDARTVVDQAATFVTDARPLVKAIPSLLGDTEEQKYLILFQNDKELRPTGGFITGYSIFKIDKGLLNPDKNDDIYPLDDSIPNKPKAPDVLANYLKVYTLNLRDSNLSPDYVESMKTFRSMYERSPQRVDVSGIIAIDTDVLVSTIKILDNTISAGGMTFTTDNDPHCDCPQAIYALENNISRPVNYIKTARKSILGDLLNAILVKALSSSPKKYWGPLLQSFITQTNQKHILFYLYDDQAQQGMEGLNAAGRIKEFDGDYLHINEANFSGAKVNIFMKEAVDSDYKVGSDGTITKTVTINYKNPYPASDCNLERGGLCLNAQYKDWVRIYVPKGSELVDSKGTLSKLTTNEDLGKTVFEGLMTVRTEGVGTLTVTYKLPVKATNGELPVLIQKQPGTYGYPYTLTVDGKQKQSFDLLTDKELKLKLR